MGAAAVAMAMVSSVPCYQMIRFASMKRLVRVDGWMEKLRPMQWERQRWRWQ